jgi:hypothetical protein
MKHKIFLSVMMTMKIFLVQTIMTYVKNCLIGYSILKNKRRVAVLIENRQPSLNKE